MQAEANDLAYRRLREDALLNWPMFSVGGKGEENLRWSYKIFYDDHSC
jgi:hypothetical protein